MSWFRRFFPSQPPAAAAAHSSEPRPRASASTLEVPDAQLPPFPFPLVAVQGRHAERAWREFHALWRLQGCSAIVVGDRNDVALLAESIELNNEKSPESILQSAADIVPGAFFEERSHELGPDALTPDRRDWPIAAPTYFSIQCDILTKNPKPVVYLARIPTVHPWEIPAHLKYGGWNDCPAPECHVAVFKDWTQRFDLEIYGVTSDVIECAIRRPPGTKAAALALAREQFLYCTDIVFQGTESISLLAATLLDSDVWYFWWD